METKSIQTAFRFKPQMLAQMKNRARYQGVSLNAYVEKLVEEDLNKGQDKIDDFFKDLKGVKVNPKTLEDINNRISSLNIHITQEEIDSDERMAYILSK